MHMTRVCGGCEETILHNSLLTLEVVKFIYLFTLLAHYLQKSLEPMTDGGVFILSCLHTFS